MCGGKNKKYRKIGNECRLTCCLIVKMVTVCQCSEGCPTIGYNVRGLAKYGQQNYVSPGKPMLGFVILLMLRTKLECYSSSWICSPIELPKVETRLTSARILPNLLLHAVLSKHYGTFTIGVVLVSVCPPAETFVVIE